ELVAAVIAANPNTIVVVNSGSPVELPWVSGARAVILPYFGGQEMGHALVDMLTGAAEPGGRLPTTWAKVAGDLPVINCTPDANNEVEYTEGIHIGYKAWLKAGTKPLYAFGHGLGYTSFSLSNLSGAASVAGGSDYQLTVDVTNTGSRSGKFVAQAYASRSNTAIERPVKWLAGFESVVVAAGQTVTVTIPVAAREFANWDGAWNYEAGEFTIEVGTAIDNLSLTHTVSVN
ncbi:MAG: glycoside hydrolase family 3 C-terminal domain-containing protein, partial [Actinomycetales bacterium]|nr:glycoside hydrolase family 3 C-terminal domain-containing protein [Actinomycetales bacterium]